MYDLIGVVCANGGKQEYIDSLRALYRNIRDDSIPEWKPDRVQYDETGTPHMPFKQATEAMIATLAVKKRIECGY